MYVLKFDVPVFMTQLHYSLRVNGYVLVEIQLLIMLIKLINLLF